VSTIEEILGRNSSGFGPENREYGRGDPLCWPLDTLYPQKLALTSPTSGGRSVGIVRLRAKDTELFWSFKWAQVVTDAKHACTSTFKLWWHAPSNAYLLRAYTKKKAAYISPELWYDAKVSIQIWNLHARIKGRTVAQLVEALWYKLEGCGFDFRWSHWIFQFTYSFQTHYGLGVDSVSNRNEYQESSWE
jgi:hypothetical protein